MNPARRKIQEFRSKTMALERLGFLLRKSAA
jgi:hypothetical protein